MLLRLENVVRSTTAFALSLIFTTALLAATAPSIAPIA